jgi:Cof subfamily protein (haloacid dehalogenase superfamily)
MICDPYRATGSGLVMSNAILKRYKMAAIDLDDTLLSRDKSIGPKNQLAVEALRSAGIKVVLASGRSLESMRPYYDQLRLSGPMVTTNGAYVRDPGNEVPLLKLPQPPDLAKRVIREGVNRSLSVVCCLEKEIYASEDSQWVQLYQRRTARRDVCFGLPADLPEREVIKVIWLSNPESIPAIYSDAQQLLGDSLNYIVTEPEYVEFMAKGADKSIGVHAVTEFYGFSQAEVLAFGDNNNDVGMLRWAGVGISVGNANEAARTAARFVGPVGPNEAESFADALDAFVTGNF